MSFITVVNKSRLPVHASLSWAAVQQRHVNDLAPAQSHEFVGAGWHDLHVVAGTPATRFPETDDRRLQIVEHVAEVAGVPGSLAGPALIPFSGGSASALFVVGTSMAVGGGVLSLGDMAFRAADYELSPVTAKALYAPDGYTVTVAGGEVIGFVDEDSQAFTVTQVNPLEVTWQNRTTHARGTERAARRELGLATS